MWSELSSKLIPCDSFVRRKCYTFLESLLIVEQNKGGVQFFFGQWYISQTRIEKCPKSKKSNVFQTTNTITIRLYTIIVPKKYTFCQEFSRPEMLYTLVYGSEWESRFWAVKSSEIIFCDPNSVLWKVIIRYNLDYTWNPSKGTS